MITVDTLPIYIYVFVFHYHREYPVESGQVGKEKRMNKQKGLWRERESVCTHACCLVCVVV